MKSFSGYIEYVTERRSGTIRVGGQCEGGTRKGHCFYFVPTLICSTVMNRNACVSGEVNYFTATWSSSSRSIRLDKVRRLGENEANSDWVRWEIGIMECIIDVQNIKVFAHLLTVSIRRMMILGVLKDRGGTVYIARVGGSPPPYRIIGLSWK